tara:strand:- start:262 stop:750 length:489 start_codon:yes stop_codon:yes gene_type:complete
MPRVKSSKTETLRVELGAWERTHVDGLLTAVKLDKFSEALTQLLSFQKLYLLITLIEIATGLEILWGTPNDLQDIIGGVRDWWTANKERFGDEGLWGYLGLGRKDPTPEEIERIHNQAQVWANAFGITVDPVTGEVGEYEAPTYANVGEVWAAAFGVNLPNP